jgi:hypothetical protein
MTEVLAQLAEAAKLNKEMKEAVTLARLRAQLDALQANTVELQRSAKAARMGVSQTSPHALPHSSAAQPASSASQASHPNVSISMSKCKGTSVNINGKEVAAASYSAGSRAMPPSSSPSNSTGQ